LDQGHFSPRQPRNNANFLTQEEAIDLVAALQAIK
jgi:hypothetical protein